MSATPRKVLIVDDEYERSSEWAKVITAFDFAGIKAEALTITDAQHAISIANQRRADARSGKNPFDGSTQCVLDDVDVLIVDYDLQDLVDASQWSTGLQVVTLARAFTRAKAIVLVNQFGTNSFDLTLTKAIASNADLDVGSGQLCNPSLWEPSKRAGFAPWTWADGVIAAADRMDATIRWVTERLDDSVLASLGFTADSEQADAPNFIQPDLWQGCVADPTTTFREMVSESEFLTSKDRDAFVNFDEPCARVAASIVAHWLDRWVIPANEVLIDLPHIASIYPWLLKDRDDIGIWQTTCTAAGVDVMLEPLGKHLFAPGFPISRPAVWRKAVLADPDLAEPAGFTYDDFPDVVFCEDVSCFVDFKRSRSFSSRLPDSDPQRFVSDGEEGKSTKEEFPTSAVSYEPSVLFAL